VVADESFDFDSDIVHVGSNNCLYQYVRPRPE